MFNTSIELRESRSDKDGASVFVLVVRSPRVILLLFASAFSILFAYFLMIAVFSSDLVFVSLAALMCSLLVIVVASLIRRIVGWVTIYDAKRQEWRLTRNWAGHVRVAKADANAIVILPERRLGYLLCPLYLSDSNRRCRFIGFVSGSGRYPRQMIRAIRDKLRPLAAASGVQIETMAPYGRRRQKLRVFHP
jgi:hypothetical protein